MKRKGRRGKKREMEEREEEEWREGEERVTKRREGWREGRGKRRMLVYKPDFHFFPQLVMYLIQVKRNHDVSCH